MEFIIDENKALERIEAMSFSNKELFIGAAECYSKYRISKRTFRYNT